MLEIPLAAAIAKIAVNAIFNRLYSGDARSLDRFEFMFELTEPIEICTICRSPSTQQIIRNVRE